MTWIIGDEVVVLLQRQIANFTYCAQRPHDKPVKSYFEFGLVKLFLDIKALLLTFFSALQSYDW